MRTIADPALSRVCGGPVNPRLQLRQRRRRRLPTHGAAERRSRGRGRGRALLHDLRHRQPDAWRLALQALRRAVGREQPDLCRPAMRTRRNTQRCRRSVGRVGDVGRDAALLRQRRRAHAFPTPELCRPRRQPVGRRHDLRRDEPARHLLRHAQRQRHDHLERQSGAVRSAGRVLGPDHRRLRLLDAERMFQRRVRGARQHSASTRPGAGAA